ncbi:PQQ-like beta-propeller repeat protein [Verrucomicrobia bacterium]|nr:PQQ-like beta-propeller repeat protein [Verrucomicrobiota bacterium]
MNAAHWERFRGPNGSGIANSSIKPSQIQSSHLIWQVNLPGEGHSSPVLWEEAIYLTSMSPTTSTFHVLALNVSNGNILWRRDVEYSAFRKHDFNSFASPSATVDADRVYVTWATPSHYFVAALNHAGAWLWKEDLGPFVSQHGVGTSPIIFENKLILANDQKGQSFLCALEKNSGSRIWTSPRRSDKAAYSTPCVYSQPDGKAYLIFNSAADGITAVQPDTGTVAWSYAQAFDKRSCSSPIVAGGKIFGSCGSGGGGNYVVAVDPPDHTLGQQVELAYAIRHSANYVPTPIAVGELVFFWSDSGFLTCADPKSGKAFYRERVRNRYFGSPVAVGDEIVCVSTTGEIVVVAAKKKFQVLNRFDLDATTHSTPGFDHQAMYVRTVSGLYKFMN